MQQEVLDWKGGVGQVAVQAATVAARATEDREVEAAQAAEDSEAEVVTEMEEAEMEAVAVKETEARLVAALLDPG